MNEGNQHRPPTTLYLHAVSTSDLLYFVTETSIDEKSITNKSSSSCAEENHHAIMKTTLELRLNGIFFATSVQWT